MARFRAFASDDEDESSASEASSSRPPTPPKVAKPVSQPIVFASSSSSSESEEDLADNSDEDSDLDEDELRPLSPHVEDAEAESAAWAQQLDLDSHRVHVMQASLFRVPELAKAHQDEQARLKHRRSPDIHAEPKEIPTRTSFAQPRTQPPARKYIRVASSYSVSASHESAYVDAGLSFGRSFRAGWGPGDKLVHVGGLASSSESSSYVLLLVHSMFFVP